MNTMHGGTLRKTLWTALGAVAFAIGLSSSAHAQTPVLRTTPTFVGNGQTFSCSVGNVSGNQLRVWVGILQWRSDDTRLAIPNGAVARQNFTYFSDWQTVAASTGFLNISTGPVAAPRGYYSCYIAFYPLNTGTLASASDVRANAQVYVNSSDSTTIVIPAQ